MGDAIYYKVSFVVEGREHPGAIINVKREPHIGDYVKFDGMIFKIVDLEELMPPAGDFGFLHATCHYIRKVAD